MRKVVKRELTQEEEEQKAYDVTWQKRFKKAMALKDDIKLSKEERYQLARWLPGVPEEYDGSWKELSSQELHDLIVMMEGFLYLTYILSTR